MILSLRRLLLASAIFAVSLASTTELRAGTITFTNTVFDGTGTGLGSIDNIFDVNGDGNASIEWGSIGWNGSKDVLIGSKFNDATKNDPTVGGQTYTATYLTTSTKIAWDPVTGSDFRVVLQVNMAGNVGQMTVSTFQLDFYKADGTILFSAPYDDGALNLGGVGTGTSGWIFNVSLSGAEAAAFFGTEGGLNRLGLSISSSDPFTNVNDGFENFYIVNSPSNPPPPPVVPEPASISLAMFGLIGLAGYRMRRRKSVNVQA
jgi:hypothetical protein